MTDTPSSGPPQEAARKASPVRVLVMMIVGGIVLAGGGCALFLGTFTGTTSGVLDKLGAVSFVIGVLLFVVGVLWAIVLGIARLLRK
jgi:hypothetical protein